MLILNPNDWNSRTPTVTDFRRLKKTMNAYPSD
jgi:hypothetical protein